MNISIESSLYEDARDLIEVAKKMINHNDIIDDIIINKRFYLYKLDDGFNFLIDSKEKVDEDEFRNRLDKFISESL